MKPGEAVQVDVTDKGSITEIQTQDVESRRESGSFQRLGRVRKAGFEKTSIRLSRQERLSQQEQE